MRSVLLRDASDLRRELEDPEPWNVLLVAGMEADAVNLRGLRELLLRAEGRCLLGLGSETAGDVADLLEVMLKHPSSTVKIIERARRPFGDLDGILLALGTALRDSRDAGFMLELRSDMSSVSAKSWNAFIDGIRSCRAPSVVDVAAPPMRDPSRSRQLGDAILRTKDRAEPKQLKDTTRKSFERFSFRCADDDAYTTDDDAHHPCAQFLRSDAKVESLAIGASAVGESLMEDLLKYCLANKFHLKSLQFDSCRIPFHLLLRFLKALPEMTALEDLYVLDLRLEGGSKTAFYDALSEALRDRRSRLRRSEITWNDAERRPLPPDVRFYLHLHRLRSREWRPSTLADAGRHEEFGASLRYAMLRHDPDRWCRGNGGSMKT